MLKNIRLHIEKDEQKQAELDQKLAKQILETHKSNINAFQRNIPTLLPYVQNTNLANYSLFINKYAENNIVDYGMGRTFYGFHPEQEVLEQLTRIEKHCPKIDFLAQTSVHEQEPVAATHISDFSSAKLINQQPPMPYEIECLVVLGCGLGIHLSHLLKRHKINNLLIYEPEMQYFQCSVMATSWQDIFALAKEQNTAIFLQLEKDGRDLIADINELIEHCAITNFHVYKHYNHQVFDSLYQDLIERSWKEIEDSGFKLKSQENYLDFLPSWTPNIDLSEHQLLTTPNEKLSKNLHAFKTFFPKIYNEYKNYRPQKWLPICNAAGEVNLVKIDSLDAWYGKSPKQDCILNFENFNEQPNKDGLMLGYNGTKLAHYIHYEFVKETEELLKQAEEEVGALPDKVPSIIMFGLGVGYQLETLLEKHTVEKLFICEPNPDFFYASLFAIDWQTIFDTVEKSQSRIYLNIGDDGTNLFRDLLSQFYAIGPYILNSTYFYQSYYNAALNSAISQLREQLQIVISMGEYFDHAYYGIAHTKEGMRRKFPLLSADPASKLSYDDKEVPIFIVGNGPSLDSSIEAIKEWQGQAIIVSCGTTLQALHRHGITPDFHAEIEQNRSTFDWAVLIGDLDYLKKITLVSCNGIHPDTCDLYKNVMIAFKEGESSTVSALNVLGRQNYTTLLNAFPTVSNFAIDLFSTIGFTSIYLIGVDLGFVDVKHHHSKSSGYYQEDGKETYDYSQSANTSLRVAGNFRPTVNTKHEFKVSRQVIEQVTAAKPRGQEFYNCSDGAKILGTLPLRPEELLIVATELTKQQAIEKLTGTIFSHENLDNYQIKFDALYSHQLLIEELGAMETLLTKKVIDKEDVGDVINKQKEMLFESYKNGHSLLFYYLYGTLNFANAVLTKLEVKNPLNEHELASINTFNTATEKWLATLTVIKNLLTVNERNDFDISAFNSNKRELKNLQYSCVESSLLVVTDSIEFKESLKLLLTTEFSWIKNLEVISAKQLETYAEVPDYVIYHLDNLTNTHLMGRENTLICLSENNEYPSEYVGITYLKTHNLQDELIFNHPVFFARVALVGCLSGQKCDLIIAKYVAEMGADLDTPIEGYSKDYVAFNNLFYISLFSQDNPHQSKRISNNGSRMKRIIQPLTFKNLLYKSMPANEFHEQKQKIIEFMHSKL